MPPSRSSRLINQTDERWIDRGTNNEDDGKASGDLGGFLAPNFQTKEVAGRLSCHIGPHSVPGRSADDGLASIDHGYRDCLSWGCMCCGLYSIDRGGTTNVVAGAP
jgi:hypothetical protein